MATKKAPTAVVLDDVVIAEVTHSDVTDLAVPVDTDTHGILLQQLANENWPGSVIFYALSHGTLEVGEIPEDAFLAFIEYVDNGETDDDIEDIDETVWKEIDIRLNVINATNQVTKKEKKFAPINGNVLERAWEETEKQLAKWMEERPVYPLEVVSYQHHHYERVVFLLHHAIERMDPASRKLHNIWVESMGQGFIDIRARRFSLIIEAKPKIALKHKKLELTKGNGDTADSGYGYGSGAEKYAPYFADWLLEYTDARDETSKEGELLRNFFSQYLPPIRKRMDKAYYELHPPETRPLLKLDANNWNFRDCDPAAIQQLAEYLNSWPTHEELLGYESAPALGTGA